MKNLWVLFVDNLCEKRGLLLRWIHLYANLSRINPCARLEETLDTSRTFPLDPGRLTLQELTMNYILVAIQIILLNSSLSDTFFLYFLLPNQNLSLSLPRVS